MNYRKNSRRMKLLLSSALAVLLAAAWLTPQLVAAPSDHQNDDHNAKLQVGYAIITPTAGSDELMVFETFGEHHGGQTTQAGVLPSAMTVHATLFVNASGRLSRNVGVAIANPGAADAAISMTLYDEEGAILGDYASSAHPPLVAGTQSAKYVTELFEGQPEVKRDFTGTLDITSSVPVAMIGIRARGENFSTLPVTSLSGPADVPPIKIDDQTAIGGPGAIVLAHFAAGGGWATEIVVANAGDTEATVRVDLFGQDGQPMVVTLNGQTASSFTEIKIPGHGVVTLAPRDGNGDSDF